MSRSVQISFLHDSHFIILRMGKLSSRLFSIFNVVIFALLHILIDLVWLHFRLYAFHEFKPFNNVARMWILFTNNTQTRYFAAS